MRKYDWTDLEIETENRRAIRWILIFLIATEVVLGVMLAHQMGLI